ncbi:MAG: hypothetical protein AB7U59_07770 [Desulfovibrionaceae bacterium]
MLLEKELGRPMTPQELARILGVCANTVRRYRERWGGVEVAPGKIRFFENKVREVLHASTTQEVQPASVAGSRNRRRQAEGKAFPGRDREESPRRRTMGSGPEKEDQEPEADRHGLADLD